MKKILFFIVVALLLSACGSPTLRSGEAKEPTVIEQEASKFKVFCINVAPDQYVNDFGGRIVYYKEKYTTDKNYYDVFISMYDDRNVDVILRNVSGDINEGYMVPIPIGLFVKFSGYVMNDNCDPLEINVESFSR